MNMLAAILSVFVWSATVPVKSPQGAMNTRVLLLIPSGNHPIATEAATRTRGELEAVGFTVTLASLPNLTPITYALNDLATNGDFLAAFAITVLPVSKRPWAEIRVWTQLSGQIVMERIAIETSNTDLAAQLAVRAVEVLRAQIADQWIHEQKPHPQANLNPLPQTQPPLTNTLHSSKAAWALGLSTQGICLVQPRLGTSLVPSLGIFLQNRSSVGARLSVAGLGSEVGIANQVGAERLSQSWFMIEGIRYFQYPARLQPFIAAGVGALHFSVEGKAVAPFRGITSQAWTGLGSVGGGLNWQFLPRVALAISAHVLVAWPPLKVNLGGGPIGRVDLPGFGFTLGLLGKP